MRPVGNTRPCPHPGVLPRRIDVRFDEVTRRSQVEGRVRGCGRAALGTVRHAPELWEIAAPMLPRSSGAVGDGTRDVAHVLRRVAGHRSAVATSYLVRFFTPSACGRGHSTCCAAHPGCCRIVVGRFRCRPGCYPRRLAHFISSAGVGRARRAGFLTRGVCRARRAALPSPATGWILPVEPLLHTAARASIWSDALIIVRQRAV